MAYDPACKDLAEHFLSDAPELKSLAARLAQHIQNEVENFIDYERRRLANELQQGDRH